MADSQVKSGNLLPTYQGLEVYGVKFTILSDGKVCANGTPTQEYTFSNTIPANISGDFYFSGCPSGGSYSSYDVFMYDKTAAARPKMWDGTTSSLSDFGGSANNQVKIVAGHETEFRIRVRQGYELRNVIFSPYLREPTSPPYYMPYSSTGWLHSLRKLGTATETLTLPQTIYADGTNATVGLKGNTVQNGTPTPSNPVDVNGVGERTENLWGDTTETNKYIDGQGNTGTATNGDIFNQKGITVASSTNYTFSWSDVVLGSDDNAPYIRICFYTSNGGTFISRVLVTPSSYPDKYVTFAIPNNCTYVDIRIDSETSTRGQHFVNLMLNTGSTAKPYEPYGYKIPISSGQQTTNIYLGSTQTTRQIKKLVLTGDETWYINNQGTANAFFSMVLANPLNVNLGISSHFVFKGIYTSNDNIGFYITTTGDLRIRTDNVSSMTKSDFTTWLSQQYAAGTPVTVWYVLQTATTGTVNEPLMKIGTYTDTLSNAASIPTTEGANSITVDTTVQPSEFTATWTGWHNASVKEWDGSHWNE